VAEQVGGAYVDVENLTSPGVEPHDVELKPKQVGAIQDADLVIHQSGFQSAVDRALDEAGRPADADVDVTDVAHQDGDDPHTWLDPRTMVAIAGAVADRLAQADPDHADAFAANAAELERRLTRLDRDLAAGLRDCETRTIVTSHDAFHYLAERYDLTQVPIAGLEPTNEPSPRQLAEISALVRREGITTIFTEELVSPAVAETVARETGARTATLDPIEGLGESNAKKETYLTLMRRNLDALRAANGCS
jgi:zinc transport system substrate-binding protein